MKLLKVMIVGVFISLMSNHPLLAGAWIVREDLVSEEDAVYLKNTNYVPVRKFAQKVKALTQEEREEITGLSFDNCLLRASGVKVIVDEVLDLFPNLRALILSNSGLDHADDSNIVADILTRFSHIEFIMIDGNGIALEPKALISRMSGDRTLLHAFKSKVVIAPEGIVQSVFSSSDLKQDTEWKDTQTRFHRWWASEEPMLLLGH